MVYSVQQIKFEILAYIKEFGADFRDWYVGVSADPKHHLLEVHGVDVERDPWIYKQAVSNRACKSVQAYFVNVLGTDGDIAEGDEGMDCVYLFKKTRSAARV